MSERRECQGSDLATDRDRAWPQMCQCLLISEQLSMKICTFGNI